ncbi:MAG: acyl-CoA thioesterase [Bacteroidetes bacterium GWA2_31_9]|nr:MAG: acyl-CoA thioesterase [Bacteroidetes bacterium GWA2_31_9]
MNQRILDSESRQFKVIFPNTLNSNDTLFGGKAMLWMDEVAYITATRFTRANMVTVSVEKIKFLTAVKSGTIAEIIGKVVRIRNATIEILVEIYVEEMYNENRKKAVEATFIFAAINNSNKPIAIDITKLKSDYSNLKN